MHSSAFYVDPHYLFYFSHILIFEIVRIHHTDNYVKL